VSFRCVTIYNNLEYYMMEYLFIILFFNHLSEEKRVDLSDLLVIVPVTSFLF
jgi:hypothetical protein